MYFDSCCTLLAQSLGSKVSYPGNAGYLATQNSYWSLQEAELNPACIFKPTTAQDVSTAVSILSTHGNCDFAIKGRSHAPAAGFANINNGVTFDMAGMAEISVNADHSVASIGAGASWLDAYAYLDNYNVTVAGGRNGAVGMGLILGGGISYLAPRGGWTCDTVVNFELVEAKGKLTNVNATSSPDLFRALKGGSNNFGVVTRFDLSTFPQDQILAGAISSPITQRAAVFSAFANIASANPYDPYASLVTGLTYAGGAWSLATTAIYTKPVLKPAVYDEFYAVPNATSSQKLTKLAPYSNETATPPLDWAFYTSTYGVSADLLGKIFDSFNQTITSTPIPNLFAWSIALEPLPTVITSYGPKKGGNSLGTSPADGNGVVMLITGIWNGTNSTSLVRETASKMLADADCIAQEMGMLHKFKYLNYADPSQDPIGSYGAENVQRLKAASRKYDPQQVFQKQVPGGFKIGAAGRG